MSFTLGHWDLDWAGVNSGQLALCVNNLFRAPHLALPGAGKTESGAGKTWEPPAQLGRYNFNWAGRLWDGSVRRQAVIKKNNSNVEHCYRNRMFSKIPGDIFILCNIQYFYLPAEDNVSIRTSTLTILRGFC